MIDTIGYSEPVDNVSEPQRELTDATPNTITLSLDEILQLRRAAGGRAKARIGKGRSYVRHETAFGAAAARRRRQIRARACQQLLRGLPVFTAPPQTIDSIHVHRTAEGVTSLVGSWPHIVAFSLELLMTAPAPFFSIDGTGIVMAFSNATATYRAFARDCHGDVVAQLEEATVDGRELPISSIDLRLPMQATS